MHFGGEVSWKPSEEQGETDGLESLWNGGFGGTGTGTWNRLDESRQLKYHRCSRAHSKRGCRSQPRNAAVNTLWGVEQNACSAAAFAVDRAPYWAQGRSPPCIWFETPLKNRQKPGGLLRLSAPHEQGIEFQIFVSTALWPMVESWWRPPFCGAALFGCPARQYSTPDGVLETNDRRTCLRRQYVVGLVVDPHGVWKQDVRWTRCCEAFRHFCPTLSYASRWHGLQVPLWASKAR